MEKKKLALGIPVSDEELARLKKYCDVTFTGRGKTGKFGEFDEYVNECSGNEIIVTEGESVTKEIIEKWKSAGMKFLITAKGTPVTVDWVALHEAGIPLGYTPGRNSVAVAEMTYTIMLMLIKKIKPLVIGFNEGKYLAQKREDIYDIDIARKIEWPRGEGTPFSDIGLNNELYGKTLGIVGYGAIGTKVARIAKAFGMKVLVDDPYVPEENMIKEGMIPSDVSTLLRESDIISIHLPVTPETKGMIDETWFNQMKDGVLFINTARAAVVDQRAFMNALESGKLSGAGLDVFWEEPVPINHPIIKMDNVVMTPHIAGQSHEIDNWTSKMVTEQIVDYCNGKGIKYTWTRLE